MLILSIVLTIAVNGCVSTGQLEPLDCLEVEDSTPTSMPTIKETIFSEELESPYIPARGSHEAISKQVNRGRLRNEQPEILVPKNTDTRRIELEPLTLLNVSKPAVGIELVWKAYKKLRFIDTIALAGSVIHDERHTLESKAEAYLLSRREPAKTFFRQAHLFDSSIAMDARVFPKHLRSCFEEQGSRRRRP